MRGVDRRRRSRIYGRSGHGPAWKGKILKFEVKAGIDDIDSASLNGVPIGETGEKVPYHWMTPRAYAIPQNAVRWGEPNRFTVRVGNLRGGAGSARART